MSHFQRVAESARVVALIVLINAGCASIPKDPAQATRGPPSRRTPLPPGNAEASGVIALASHAQSQPTVPEAPEPGIGESSEFAIPGGALTLADFQAIASQLNPTLVQASAGIASQTGQYEQVGLYPNPQLGYLNNSANPSRVQQGNGAFISQEIVTAKKLKLARIWQGYEVNRVGWEAESQRIRVLNDLAIRFYEALGAQEVADVTTKLVELAESGVEMTKALLENKHASQIELNLAEIQSETMRIAKQDAVLRYHAAWRQLANMAGNPNLTLVKLAGSLDQGIPELDFETSWQELEQNSPQLAGLNSGLAHARAELTLSRAQVIPNVTIQTVLQRDNGTQATEASTLVSLPLPVYNRNQGNIHRATADIRAAEAEIERTKLVLRDQLADSFKRYETNRLQAARYREVIIPKAEQSMEAIAIAWKGGDRSVFELLASRQMYFQAQLAYVESLIELRKAIVEIEGLELTGGLNPSAIGTAVQSQAGGMGQRQRLLLNQVQDNAAQQLLPAAQLGR